MIDSIYRKKFSLIGENTLHPLEILQIKKTVNFIEKSNVIDLLNRCKNFFFSDLDEESCEKLVRNKTSKRRDLKLVSVHHEDLLDKDLTFEKVKQLYDQKINNGCDTKNNEFQYFIYKGNRGDHFLIVNRFPFKNRLSYHDYVSFDRYTVNNPETVNKFFYNYFSRSKKNFEVYDFISHVVEITENRGETNPARSSKTLKEILNLMVVFDVVYLLTINKNDEISVFVKMFLGFRGDGNDVKMVVTNINFEKGKPKIVSHMDLGDVFLMGFVDRFFFHHHYYMRIDNSRKEIKYLKTASYFILRNFFSVERFDYFGIIKNIMGFIKNDVIGSTDDEKNRYDFITISRNFNENFEFSFFNVFNNHKRTLESLFEPYFIKIVSNSLETKKYKFQLLVWNNTNKNNIYQVSNSLGASIIVFDDSFSYDPNKNSMISRKIFYKRYVIYHQGRKNLNKQVFKNLNDLLHRVVNRRKNSEKDKITRTLLMSPCEIDDIKDYI